MRRLTIVAALMLAGTQAQAGAWPRGEGNLFLSLKYTGAWDREAIMLRDFTRENRQQVYGEWGVAPRLTFGAEVARSGPEEAPIRERRVFGRYTFLQRGRHVMSAELGFGGRANDFQYEVSYVRPGLAWGGGFESRFGAGWMELDGQAEIYESDDAPALKLDATLGLNLTDRLTVVMQGRAGDYPGTDPYFRLAPSVVVRLTDWLRVQAEVEAGAWNDTGVAAALGLWIEF